MRPDIAPYASDISPYASSYNCANLQTIFAQMLDKLCAILDSFSANLHNLLETPTLNIQVLHIERILFNKLAPALNILAH
jgi:hypothetical protein